MTFPTNPILGGGLRRACASAVAGLTFALMAAAPSAFAATTPVFVNNIAGGSTLSGDQDVDITVGAPANVVSNMPSAGSIPGTAALLAPWNGAGFTIAAPGGTSKAKGGAGHTEGSNLAKITFPSGAGLDQTDPAPHDVGPSRYRMNFNYKWNLSNPGTLGPPMSGTFNIPLAVKVGAGAGAYAKFEWDVNWDAVVSGVTVPNVRTPFSGTLNYTGAGTYVSSVTAPASGFSPSAIAGAGANQLIVRGYIAFEANNDDSRTVIELLGKSIQDLDDELRADPFIMGQYLNNPGTYQVEPYIGFEEFVPEPSSALLAACGCAATLLRRRRQRA